jgi:ribosomal protein L32E
MRKTRDGSLLIEIEKREGNVGSIEKIVKTEAAGYKTKKLDPSGMTVFHIRGMDELTTVDELEKALKDVTDQKETHLTSEKT